MDVFVRDGLILVLFVEVWRSISSKIYLRDGHWFMALVYSILHFIPAHARLDVLRMALAAATLFVDEI